MNVLEDKYNLTPLRLVLAGWASLAVAYGAYIWEWESIIRIVFIMLPFGLAGVVALAISFLWAPRALLKDSKSVKNWVTMLLAGIPPAAAVTFMLMWSVISPYAYSHNVDVDGFNIRVGFQADHPTEPRYKRYVHADMYGIIEFGRDAGGIDYVNVYNLDKFIVLQTFWDKIIIINKKTKDFSLVERALSDKEKAAFFGKFHFIEPNRYGFTYKKDDAKFDPMIMGSKKK